MMRFGWMETIKKRFSAEFQFCRKNVLDFVFITNHCVSRALFCRHSKHFNGISRLSVVEAEEECKAFREITMEIDFPPTRSTRSTLQRKFSTFNSLKQERELTFSLGISLINILQFYMQSGCCLMCVTMSKKVFHLTLPFLFVSNFHQRLSCWLNMIMLSTKKLTKYLYNFLNVNIAKQNMNWTKNQTENDKNRKVHIEWSWNEFFLRSFLSSHFAILPSSSCKDTTQLTVQLSFSL